MGVDWERKHTAIKRKLQQVNSEREEIRAQLERAKQKINQLIRERSLLLERILRTENGELSNYSASETGSDVSDSDMSVDEPVTPEPTHLPSHVNGHETIGSTSSTPRASASTSSHKAKEPVRRQQTVIKKPPRKIQYVPHDSEGKPILPLKIGVLTLTSLGKVIWDNPKFHSNRYIWPVGFETVRTYQSTKSPTSNAQYRCRIVEADGHPQFEVIPDDDPDNIIKSPTATGAWTTVLKMANKIRQKESSNSASGPDYFGFSHPTIAKLIQDLPGADKCANYVWQDYLMPDKPPSTKSDRKSKAKTTTEPSEGDIDLAIVDDDQDNPNEVEVEE